MQKIITLEAAAEKVRTWRSKKKSVSDPIPDDIKVIIAQLLQHYSPHQIHKGLNIGYRMIHKIKSKSTLIKANLEATPINFIAFKQVETESDKPKLALNNCEIIRPDGIKLIINSANIDPIIKAFLCFN